MLSFANLLLAVTVLASGTAVVLVLMLAWEYGFLPGAARGSIAAKALGRFFRPSAVLTRAKDRLESSLRISLGAHANRVYRRRYNQGSRCPAQNDHKGGLLMKVGGAVLHTGPVSDR